MAFILLNEKVNPKKLHMFFRKIKCEFQVGGWFLPSSPSTDPPLHITWRAEKRPSFSIHKVDGRKEFSPVHFFYLRPKLPLTEESQMHHNSNETEKVRQ